MSSRASFDFQGFKEFLSLLYGTVSFLGLFIPLQLSSAPPPQQQPPHQQQQPDRQEVVKIEVNPQIQITDNITYVQPWTPRRLHWARFR
jgi:hypothetical protein